MSAPTPSVPRRHFLGTAAAAGAATAALTVLGATRKGSGRTLKVALIGCGGRGNGALGQHIAAARTLNSALNLDIQVQVVGTHDYFKDKAERTGQRHRLPASKCFGGANGYKPLLELKPDIVLTATPPVFRPEHFEAAVQAGAHVFMEKPVAVDPPGVRKVIQAGELAKKKGLMVVAGTQRRHEKSYIDTYQAVAVEGALGKLCGGRVSWCGGHAFNRQPVNPKTADDLVRSWKVWIELSGDHIVEQHVHNLDVANWFVGRHPVTAAGIGARHRRPAGNMYDNFSIDLDYGDGVHIHSMCRQMAGCWGWQGQEFIYQKGTTSGTRRTDVPRRDPRARIEPKSSPIPRDLPQVRGGHNQEHVNLLYYLAKRDIHYNEARNVAEATATAIMGRHACYTGKLIHWDEMFEDPNKNPELYNLTLRPSALDFEKGTVEILKEGVAPVPGRPA